MALVGGAEFGPGNEAQDRLLAGAGGPAYIIATAAARQQPDRAVATAQRWFDGLDLAVAELRLRSRRDADDAATVAQARAGRFFYLAGGDPGLVVSALTGTCSWDAVVSAWRTGAALAGSSAGAMALCQWILLRDGWPDRTRRRWAPALGLVSGVAVIPHLDTFGSRWLPSVQSSRPAGTTLLGVDERTAAVFSGGGWWVMGPGRVVVFGDAEPCELREGDTIPGLPVPGA